MMKKISIRNRLRIVWFSVVAVFMLWQWSTYQAKGIEPSFLMTDDLVEVRNGKDKISFIPKDSSGIDVIFFPGGLVDPQAYAPLARQIAAQGYHVHIIRMLWRMSVNGYNRIKTIFELDDKSRVYVLGGHSQGAKMAAQFVYENPGLISGLYLLGTSHPRDIDLSGISIPAIKVYAEYDGLASVEEVEENFSRLPANTDLKLIEGGNHSQFGYFGSLLFDGSAQIDREKQHEMTVQHLVGFLNQIKRVP